MCVCVCVCVRACACVMQCFSVEAFHLQIAVHLHANKTNVHTKGFQLGLASLKRAKSNFGIAALSSSLLVVVYLFTVYSNASSVRVVSVHGSIGTSRTSGKVSYTYSTEILTRYL